MVLFMRNKGELTMEIKMKNNGLLFNAILSAVSDVCYEHSKYDFLNTSKDNLVNILYNSVFDDFNTVLNCIILNNKSISYDIIVNVDEKKDYIFDNIFDCDYDTLYYEIINAIKNTTNINFSENNYNIKYVIQLFVQNIALVIQDVQSVDVYKYYKSLDYNKNEFVSIMPNDLKELAEIIIKYKSKYYNNFDIKRYMNEIIDDMCTIYPDTINSLRTAATLKE